MLSKVAVLLFAGAVFAADGASASTLSISPVVIEIPAPGKTSKITLHNRGEDTIAAQIRVFRWSQIKGVDQLVPTTDMVASPPAAKLLPGAQYTVRLVRVAKHPVQGEESYRLLIDQLPKLAAHKGTNVSFVVRHSLPVFYQDSKVQTGPISWSAKLAGKTLLLSASNHGTRRARLSGVKITSASGATLSKGDGLSGYVLGQSTITWPLPAPKGVKARSSITITAKDESGPLQATAKIGSAP
jgi:fimbrial chaperone protein